MKTPQIILKLKPKAQTDIKLHIKGEFANFGEKSKWEQIYGDDMRRSGVVV